MEITALEDDVTRLEEEKYQDQITIDQLKNKLKHMENDRHRKGSSFLNPKTLLDLEKMRELEIQKSQ